MGERAGIFDEAADFDVSKFKPIPVKPQDQPSVEAVREVSEKASFQSREPAAKRERPASKAPEAKPAVRRLRRKRTGRNLQLNVKTDAATLESFYDLADSRNWGLGETLEKAIAALRKEIAAEK